MTDADRHLCLSAYIHSYMLFLALLKIMPVYLIYIFIAMSEYLLYTMCACACMYRGGALQWTIYMMLIGYAIYTKLGVLINACMI